MCLLRPHILHLLLCSWGWLYEGSLWRAAFWSAIILHSDKLVVWDALQLSLLSSLVFFRLIYFWRSLNSLRFVFCSWPYVYQHLWWQEIRYFQFLKMFLSSTCSMNLPICNLSFCKICLWIKLQWSSKSMT